jgi:hypothetical protein
MDALPSAAATGRDCPRIRRGQPTASVRLLLSAVLIALVTGSTRTLHDVTTHVTWNRRSRASCSPAAPPAIIPVAARSR